MKGNEYQKLAMRTNDGKCTDRLKARVHRADIQTVVGKIVSPKLDVGGILNGCLGLSGEVGEFNDMMKKWIFHEATLDVEHAQKELGDILWYVAMLCESFGWDMDTIMQMNVDKLKARYPEGFDVQKSEHRAEGDV